MAKPPRRLLMIASICCVVPLLGANAPAPDDSGCPYARSKAAALAAASQGPTAAVAVTDVSRIAPWLVP
ncbi:MAG TPA: hypothetical protein VE820_07075 [Sphingomicrobium sp.]|jgi:hypothetical protein|nr:hypothetical protein [Sphingomicrobium sp.]